MKEHGLTDKSVCWGLHRASQELRDRWRNGLSKMKDRHRAVQKEDISENDETGAGSVERCVRRQKGGKVPRKAHAPESDDEDGWLSAPLHWVPYVHFGV
jgi:hypothetical protein